MFRRYDPNPAGRNVGDCAVRAVSKATGQSWCDSYLSLCMVGYRVGDMPSANDVWGAYLREHGFRRRMLPDTCPDCYTVEEFAETHPVGTFVLALSGHVVCVENGDIFDSWDSSGEAVLYYWERTEMQ